MTNENQVTTNRVILCGIVESEPTLSHELYGEGFYEFSLSVPRLSEQRDVIPVTVAERVLLGSTIRAGDTIALEGQFRSYNKVIESHSKLMLTVFVKEFLDPAECGTNPNSVELIGYVCKEPIYRTTPLSREICDLLVAVNRAFNKSDYIPCIAWGRNARYGKMLSVGTKLIINGRIQSRQYVKKLSEEISETRTAYEISVGRIDIYSEDNNAE
ncbi:MAG: single-stranded DNA-binding protein [Clostridia bacterium]|nr:single-stranded DNA-binding protein [Clostridia bacterium]